MGGTFHLRLNTNSSPIANKYREGKVQSTLERELNVPETAVMQAYGTCAWLEDWESLGCHAVGQWANACSCCLFTLKIPPLILWRLPTRVHARSKAYRRSTFGLDSVLRTELRTAFMWSSAFSYSACWKCRGAYWYELLHQGIRVSRHSPLCWPARCHTTRLETRTKESIHMCEYVSSKLVCVMKVTVGT